MAVMSAKIGDRRVIGGKSYIVRMGFYDDKAKADKYAKLLRREGAVAVRVVIDKTPGWKSRPAGWGRRYLVVAREK